MKKIHDAAHINFGILGALGFDEKDYHVRDGQASSFADRTIRIIIL